MVAASPGSSLIARRGYIERLQARIAELEARVALADELVAALVADGHNGGKGAPAYRCVACEIVERWRGTG